VTEKVKRVLPGSWLDGDFVLSTFLFFFIFNFSFSFRQSSTTIKRYYHGDHKVQFDQQPVAKRFLSSRAVLAKVCASAVHANSLAGGV